MKFLDKSEWVHLAPDTPRSVRVNHNSPSCSGDSKSLKITRTEDDRLYAKCYRCGGWGRDGGNLAGVGAFARHVHAPKVKIPNEVKLPGDFTNEIRDMPVAVRSKLHQCKVGQNLVNQYGIGWSPRWERLIFPVYHGSELAAFQARYFGTDPEASKYITRYKDSGALWQLFKSRNAPLAEDMVVIVEDMLSAVRVAEMNDCVCLYGTELSDEILVRLATNGFKRGVIWLDWDNHTVRKKGVNISDRLTMVGIRGTIMVDTTDPKHFTYSEIENILKDKLKSLRVSK